jgi:transcription-repair coupling factor (superfamily II helicase)
VTLASLLAALQASPRVQRLLDVVRANRQVAISDLPLAARPAVIAAVTASLRQPALIVTSRDDRAEQLCNALNELLPGPSRVEHWPAPDALPYEQLPFDLPTATQRVAILNRFLTATEDRWPIVTVSVRGLSHLVMPPDELRRQTHHLHVDDRLDATQFFAWATEVGYQLTPVVQEPGTIARRGGIIDIFPPTAEDPIRIELFGDVIDSIRLFDPSSQRSRTRLNEVTLLPPLEVPLRRLPEAAKAVRQLDLASLRTEVASEWESMIERMQQGLVPASLDLFAPYLLCPAATLADYLPANGLVILDEPGAIRLTAHQLQEHASELVAGFVDNGELPPGLLRPFAIWPEIEASLKQHRQCVLGIDPEHPAPVVESLSAVTEAPLYAGRLRRLTEDVGQRLADQWRVVLATDQVERLTELFEEQNIFPRRDKRRNHAEIVPLQPGTLEIVASDLDGGWMIADDKLVVLSDLEIFGFRKQTRRSGRRSHADDIAFATSLTPGEFVVHIDHGIARFRGLVRVETNGVEREYLLLEYARGDRLYVPVDQSHRVTRYSGAIEPEPTRLGSGEWIRTKQRVRRAVREMAFELIQLYAARETVQGHAFGPDTAWDVELAESFPYTETPDQLRAINEVKADMESPRPMDRLVCGDVGYGKTEVALRAAFKAVNGGKQVAILVPTTVLALQHFATFSQRLAPFPVRVEMLSRLRSEREQREIVEGLANGSVDIVIGTHRLVQKDVHFKDLGLVIIDEEQRFGVRHKEYLKQLRTAVDVLTMSATPIPRTLHMALAGIRDISVIDTPPQARLPVRTFVTEAKDSLIREVILRELERGGQVYVVHNRVHSIDRLAHRLRELVPEARLGIGHGQMDEQTLEEVILGFVRHEFDVLVCTTIIESGVDIPNVNTIIIDNADTLGLTQLYQLRGRVGRGTNRAYAYLLYKPAKVLTTEAQARLEAIQEATELGAGLRVAMRDMEIRGAGNILGAEQSGHIAEVGYELYVRLLSQAVEEIKRGRPVEEPGAIQLDLPLSALIPATYITDVELRLNTYRCIAGVSTRAELEAMRAELEDRFGPIPDEVEHLLALIAVRLRCADLGIESVVEREREIIIRPVETRLLDARKLATKLGRALKITPHSVRIRLPDLQLPWMEALDTVLDAVEAAPTRARASQDTPASDRQVLTIAGQSLNGRAVGETTLPRLRSRHA